MYITTLDTFKPLSIIIPESRITDASEKTIVREDIDLTAIDLIIFDFDDTLIERSVEITDDICDKLNDFFTQLIQSGKKVCICTAGNRVSAIMSRYPELLIKKYHDRVYTDRVMVFNTFTIFDDKYTNEDDYIIDSQYPILKTGYDSKNSLIGPILRIYNVAPQCALFIDDQIEILHHAQIAFGIKVLHATTGSIIDSFDDLTR